MLGLCTWSYLVYNVWGDKEDVCFRSLYMIVSRVHNVWGYKEDVCFISVHDRISCIMYGVIKKMCVGSLYMIVSCV